MKMTMHFDRLIEPVSLRKDWLINRACRPTVAVPHLALDLGARHERGDAVDDEHVDRARANERVHDLQRLLARIRLADDEVFDVDAEFLRVDGIERVFGVDERRRSAELLRFGDDMECKRCFTRRFRTINFDNAALGQPADAQSEVQTERAGRDNLDLLRLFLAKPHRAAFAKRTVDLRQSGVQRPPAVPP